MGSGRRRSLLLPLLLLLPAVWGACGPLPRISHAEPPEDTKHLESFSVGSKVTYGCVQGYVKRPLRSDTIQCLDNSQWSSLTEFCGRSCPSPLRVPFAKISGEDETLNFYPVDVTVRYSCRLGYESITEQPPTSTCRDNLTWSEVPKLCQRKSCGIPANPEHGKVIAKEYLFGTKAEVVCNPGYTLKGALSHVLCSLRGAEVAWGQIPACQAVSCPPPPAIPGGKHNGTGTGEFPYDSVVTYTCEPGLRLVGEESLRCTTENNVSGVWSTAPPQCRVSTTAVTDQTKPSEDKASENRGRLVAILIPSCIALLLVLGILAVILRRWKDNKRHSLNLPLQKQKTKGKAPPTPPMVTGEEKQPVPWHSYFCHTTSCHVCPTCEEGLHAALAPHAEPVPHGCATCEEWLGAQPHAPRSFSIPSIGSGNGPSPAGTSSPPKTADVLRGEDAEVAVLEQSDAEQPMDHESSHHCPICEDWLRTHLSPWGRGPAAPGEQPGGPHQQDEGPQGPICPPCADRLHLSLVHSDRARCPVCPLAGEGTPAHLIPHRTPGCHVCPVCAAPTHSHLCQPQRQAPDG